MKTNIIFQKEAQELRKLGLTLDEITKKVGKPRGTVFEWIKKVELSKTCRLSPKEGAKFFEIYLAKKQKLIDNLNGRVSPLASNQEKE